MSSLSNDIAVASRRDGLTRSDRHRLKAILRLLFAVKDRDAALRQRMQWLEMRGLPSDIASEIDKILSPSSAQLEALINHRYLAEIASVQKERNGR